MISNYDFLKSRVFIYITGLIFCYSWALYAGKDINWDSLNYHLYAGYSSFENRLDKDYFAASWQQYLNPYSHLPFYLMVKFDLNSKIVALIFTMFHALNLLIIYEISVTIHQKKIYIFLFF